MVTGVAVGGPAPIAGAYPQYPEQVHLRLKLDSRQRDVAGVVDRVGDRHRARGRADPGDDPVDDAVLEQRGVELDAVPGHRCARLDLLARLRLHAGIAEDDVAGEG